MGWASKHIENLRLGKKISFRPFGGSMEPQIKSGQLCTVIPIKCPVSCQVVKGDVVLCKVNGKQYLHKVQDVKYEEGKYLIGNNRGGINGWIDGDYIYGILTEIGD